MKPSPPVLMIGLDAAEAALVDRLCADGRMPALRDLRQRGCSGILESNARLFGGAVWPTFYASRDVPWTGLYHNKMWRPERMRCEVVSDDWLPVRPFWRELSPDYRVAAIDVPTVLGLPTRLNGLELDGWGNHDLFSRGSLPRELWRELRARFGAPRMTLEMFGPQDAGSLLRLRGRLVEAADQAGAIGESLFRRGGWDVFLLVLGAPHRGGHYLWDISQIDRDSSSPSALQTLSGALVDVYEACDRAVARLVECAPDDARVIVFAVHGMEANTGWSERFPEVLARVQEEQQGVRPKPGLAFRFKCAVPWRLARQITTRIPQGVASRLVELWSSRMFDWASTPYFPIPMDLAGFVRVNLRGREREGIVEPGAAYETLCAELEDAFLSFRDIDSGEPVVDRVHRLEEIAPPDAPYRHLLPDLVVTWRQFLEGASRGVVSRRWGTVTWPNPARLPSGRAGNHTDHGWFVAAGPGIPPGSRVEGHSILDLVPTVFRWLGAATPREYQGRPIAALTAAGLAP